MIKIHAPNGGWVLVGTRKEQDAYPLVKSVGSTEPQPWFSANFTADGVCTGGRTMQDSMKNSLLEKAKASGFKIEEV